MDITVEAIEALRVPDAFAPVVGFRRFGIPWPSGNENSYELVQKGHRWAPSGSTEAECRRMGTAPCEKRWYRVRAVVVASTPGWKFKKRFATMS